MKGIEKRYRKALANIPAPGTGCHPYLLRVANYAVMAGRSDTEALEEIRASIPQGDRIVDDQEIIDAIEKARQDTTAFVPGCAPFPPIPRPRPTEAEILDRVLKVKTNAEKLRRAVIEAGGGELDPFGSEVRNSSSIRPETFSEAFPFAGGMIQLLRHLYRPDDVVLIGRQYDAKRENLKTAAEWTAFFERQLAWISEQPTERQQYEFQLLGELYPLITPNPLTGGLGLTKKGEESLRADSCVAEYRYAIAEFDDMPFNEQGAILRGLCKAGVRIAALIYSGNKSLHAWLCCDGISNAAEWKTQVKKGLFPILGAVGADTACSNPGRLSRLPGVFRDDKKTGRGCCSLRRKGVRHEPRRAYEKLDGGEPRRGDDGRSRGRR